MGAVFGHVRLAGADVGLVERMGAALFHRGPDEQTIHHDGLAALGARRLAPLREGLSRCGGITAAFDGALYNAPALRAELARAGYAETMPEQADLLARGYQLWGEGLFERLRGVFGLCVWDADRQRLLLGRDGSGERYIYLWQTEDELLFASEIKALLLRGMTRRVHREALYYYVLQGQIPPGSSLFAGVSRLLPGEFVCFEVTESRLHRRSVRFFQPMPAPAQRPFRQSVTALRAALHDTMAACLSDDAPVGVALSGGLDSTVIAGLAQDMRPQPVVTFTIGYDFAPGSRGDAKFNLDARFAALAAQRFGTDHHLVTIPFDNPHLPDLLPALIYALDEPVAQHSLIQQAYLSAAARRCGLAALLNGNAGDELFLSKGLYGGDLWVSRYQMLPRLLRDSLMQPLIERLPGRLDRLRKLAQRARLPDDVTRHLAYWALVPPPHLADFLTDPAAETAAALAAAHIGGTLRQHQGRHFTERMAYAVFRLYYDGDSNLITDKLGMMFSTTARAPFEDRLLALTALDIPLAHKLRRGDGKAVLKAAADFVPSAILNRPKYSFTPPISDWLRTALRSTLMTYLSPQHVAEVGCFRPETVARLVDEHLSKRGYHLLTLWMVLLFHIWHAVYIESSVPPRHFTPDELLA